MHQEWQPEAERPESLTNESPEGKSTGAQVVVPEEQSAPPEPSDESIMEPSRTYTESAASESALSELRHKVFELTELFRNRLAYDESKEELIRRLSEELSRYRDGFYQRLQRPLLRDLVMLHDSLKGIRHDVQRAIVLDAAEVDARLSVLSDELLEVLARQDVLPYDEHPEFLDLRHHRTIRTEPTADPAENNRVAQIVREGFKWTDGILRPEEVVIRKYQPKQP